MSIQQVAEKRPLESLVRSSFGLRPVSPRKLLNKEGLAMQFESDAVAADLNRLRDC
jgi:hypothetical protein